MLQYSSVIILLLFVSENLFANNFDSFAKKYNSTFGEKPSKKI